MLSIHSGMSFLNDYPAPSNMSLESCSQPTTVAAATSFHRSSPTFSIDSHEDWRYIKNEAMTSQEMATSQSSTTSTSTTSSAFIYPHQQPRKYQDNLPVDSFGRLACPNDMIHTIYDPFISRPYSPPTTYHYSASSSSSPSLMSTDSCLSKHPSSHHYHRQQQQQPYFYTSPVYYPANSYHYGLADGGHVRRSSTNTSRSSSPVDGARQASANSASKRYVCQVCNKGFTRPSSLTTHTYSHTGEKPFKCPVENCGRKFSVVSNLRRHTKIHNSSTPSNNATLKL